MFKGEVWGGDWILKVLTSSMGYFPRGSKNFAKWGLKESLWASKSLEVCSSRVQLAPAFAFSFCFQTPWSETLTPPHNSPCHNAWPCQRCKSNASHEPTPLNIRVRIDFPPVYGFSHALVMCDRKWANMLGCWSARLTYTKLWAWSPVSHKTGTAVHMGGPSMWETEAEVKKTKVIFSWG